MSSGSFPRVADAVAVVRAIDDHATGFQPRTPASCAVRIVVARWRSKSRELGAQAGEPGIDPPSDHRQVELPGGDPQVEVGALWR